MPTTTFVSSFFYLDAAWYKHHFSKSFAFVVTITTEVKHNYTITHIFSVGSKTNISITLWQCIPMVHLLVVSEHGWVILHIVICVVLLLNLTWLQWEFSLTASDLIEWMSNYMQYFYVDLIVHDLQLKLSKFKPTNKRGPSSDIFSCYPMKGILTLRPISKQEITSRVVSGIH